MEDLFLAVFLVLFVGWAATTARRPDDHQVDAMAAMYRIPLSPAVIARLRSRVMILRRWRLLGALAGFAVAAARAVVTSIDLTINAVLFSVAVGYGVASIVAELADAHRPMADGRAVATLRPRGIRSIVGPIALLPAGLSTLMVGAVLVVHLVWRPGDAAAGDGPLSDGQLIVGIVLYAVTLAIAVIGIVMILRAPERGPDPAAHVVRRASRVVAVMTVLGATWMIMGVLGSVMVRPLWSVRPDAWLASAGFLIATLVIALSGPMGFLATVTTLPRNRPWRRRPPSFQTTPEGALE